MALKPENRYPRADDLAEDVRRWIVDEPVSVHRDPLAVRALRWGRRHRTLSTGAAALVATAVIALSVGLVLTDSLRNIARNNATRALQNLRLAQDAADILLGEVADVDLADIPQMEPVRRRLLEKARGGYEQFMVEGADDPLVRWGAVRAQVRLGDIEAIQGDAAKAEASYRAAGRELEKLVKQDVSNVGIHRDLARALHGLGMVLRAHAMRKAKPSFVRRSSFGKISSGCRMQQRMTGKPSRTASIVWGRSWVAAAVKTLRLLMSI